MTVFKCLLHSEAWIVSDEGKEVHMLRVYVLPTCMTPAHMTAFAQLLLQDKWSNVVSKLYVTNPRWDLWSTDTSVELPLTGYFVAVHQSGLFKYQNTEIVKMFFDDSLVFHDELIYSYGEICRTAASLTILSYFSMTLKERNSIEDWKLYV